MCQCLRLYSMTSTFCSGVANNVAPAQSRCIDANQSRSYDNARPRRPPIHLFCLEVGARAPSAQRIG